MNGNGKSNLWKNKEGTGWSTVIGEGMRSSCDKNCEGIGKRTGNGF